jgi:hypothetical protein
VLCSIAEILAIFFSSVFTDEDVNNLPKMEKRNSDIATDEPFSQEEIKKLLLGLNTRLSIYLVPLKAAVMLSALT